MFTDIKRLKTFVAIVEEESFTGAAERLNMAQPWVSVQLKQLEDMLDLVLVERAKGKLIKLSPDGEELLPIAKRLLTSCEEAGAEINAMRNRGRARFVLGVDPITLYMPERNNLIAQFMARMPETDLQIVSLPPCDLFAGLKSGRFDLILTSCPNPDEEVETLPLYDYDLHLFVPKRSTADYQGWEECGASPRILTLPDTYHPGIFSWLKQSLAPVDVQWKTCPEVSFQALIRYAAMLGLATLTPDFSTSIPELESEMSRQPMRSHKLTVRWGLMRRQGYRRRTPEKFWKMASQLRTSKVAQPSLISLS